MAVVNPDEVDTSAEEERAIAIWRLKRTIEELEAFSGSGTSVISLLIPPGEQISAITNMLAGEYGTASNIKSRVNRNAVLAAITSASNRLKLYNRLPPNGLALFCGEIEDRGKIQKVVIDLTPYKPISNFIYLCDSRFHTEHLRELLTNDDAYGFIIMDGHGTLWGTVSGNSRQIIQRFLVDLPKKHGRGGQSSVRFARLREESRHHYVTKVAEMSVKNFINPQTNRPTVKGLVLAGSADFKNVLALSDAFDVRLKSIVCAQIDINYGGEMGFNQAIDLVSDTLKDIKLMQEVRHISDFLENIATDSKKFAFGIIDTTRCLEMSSVEKLLVWEDLPHHRVVFRDPAKPDGTIIRYYNKEQMEDISNFVDKATGEKYDVLSDDLLAEWLVDNYRGFGCRLEFVSDKSSEGAQFVHGFGGIGAILRWQVDLNELEKQLQDDQQEDADLIEDLEDFI